MSVISLDAQAIESLNQEIIALDNSLIQNYLPELEEELNAINGNVKGDEINPIINTILSQFQGVKSSLSTEMPKLEAFLEQQLKSYTQTEEELEAELQTVMNRMVTLADRVNGVTSATNGGFDPETGKGMPQETSEESKLEEIKDVDPDAAKDARIAELEKQVQELSKSNIQKANDEFLREAGADNSEFGERFVNDWSNVGQGYQDGLISGVVNTLGATWNTGANAIGWTWNQAVNCVEWGLGAVGLGKGTLGDGLAWLIS